MQADEAAQLISTAAQGLLRSVDALAPGERFAALRDSLQRGLVRLDTVGHAIVHDERAMSEADHRVQLELFLSGIVQTAAAATAMLSVLPVPSAIAHQVVTTRNTN